VLIAVGICRNTGKRMVLGTSAQLSEAEVHWRTFLSSLKERGMAIPDTVTSDAHEGLKKAITCVLPGVPWQRCQFHLQQNAMVYVPKQEMKAQVAKDIRQIFNAPNRQAAQQSLEYVAQSYAKSAPQLSLWMLDNIPEGLTIQDYPEKIRRKLRTSNMMENINKQIKRRTKVACLFPNTNSILRLVSALLQEISDDWESGRAFINPQL
jgi:transposase-like protein